MGVRNYLVEGVSATGKTSVCEELRRRGYHAINGDTDLAYQGDPETGEPTVDVSSHWHHIWPVDKVRALVADQEERFTFFCGGSRNFTKFLDLFDGVFVLEIDLDTLNRRLDQRPGDEFGADPSERDLILRLHRTREATPQNGIRIDATAPLAEVVDEIVRRASAIDSNHEQRRGDHARGRLEAERAETLRRLTDLAGDYGAMVAASRDSNADDEHDPEGATIAFERSQVGALVRQAQLHVAEIDAALDRLAIGAYGICEACGGAIGLDRLEARPVARTCIQCAAGR